MRKQLKRAVLAGTGLVLAAGSALAVAPAASAAPAGEVPVCVQRAVTQTETTLRVSLRNVCWADVKARILFENPVENCKQLPWFQPYSLEVPLPNKFVGLETC